MAREEETSKPEARVLSIQRSPLRSEIGAGLVRTALLNTLGFEVECFCEPPPPYSWGRTYLRDGRIMAVEFASNDTGLFHLVLASDLEPDKVLFDAPNVQISFAESPWDYAQHLRK